jgi:tetratricopeptide (TPR) repeat protein
MPPAYVVTMKLEHPDTLHLSAAQGWLELGNPAEAQAELAKIAAQWLEHPEVLMMRWQIGAKLKQWDDCLGIAESIIKLSPDLPIGFINKAVAFHGMKRYQEAWDTLHPAFEKFPGNKYVMYDLACYECLLGRHDRAKELLEQIFTGEDAVMWKQMAINDPDFEQIKEYLLRKNEAP